MLRKLYKYDFICSARKVVPLLVVYFVITIISTITENVNNDALVLEIFSELSSLSFIFLSVIVFFCGFAESISRFRKNLFTDEGYLMNTLPVKPWQHILSKLLNALTWGVFSSIAIIIAFTITKADNGIFYVFRLLGDIIEEWISGPVEGICEGILMLLNVLISIISFCFVAFLSNAIEMAIPVFKKKAVVLVSGIVVSFVVVYSVIYGTILVSNLVEVFDITHKWMMVFIELCILVFNIIIAVASFVGTNYLMSKKLNLE